MVKLRKSIISIFIILLTITLALSSCKMKAEQKSLTLYFEVIDSYIAEGDFKSAIKELKRTEKVAYDSWSYIGLYKRYSQIGEEKLCEKLLKRALKKNPHNQELTAIYSNFLIRHNRVNEAARKSEELRGTKYGSIYSEAVLRIEREKVNSQDNPEYYKDPKFYEIYFDAYKAAADSIWMRNCAVYHLNMGNYENAAALSPKQFSDGDDAYFWAMVLFDGGRYYDAAEAVVAARRFIDVYPNLKSGKKEHPSKIQLIALESDSYMAVSEVEKANDARKEITENLQDFKIVTKEENDLLQTITTNSIIYANNTEDSNTAYDLLLYTVNQWPTFQDGLALYSDFAYKSNEQRYETKEEKTLREMGLASLEMEKYDSRRVIPLSEAASRLEKALNIEKNPYLSILQLDMKYKIDSSFTEKQKTADLWTMLEDNYTQEVKFHNLLVQYTLNYLLKTDQYTEAYELFYKYMVNTYDFDRSGDFWMQLQNVITKIDLKMAEFAAYFAARQGLYAETFRLYEYVVYESGGHLEEKYVSPYVSTGACMNLADAYYSTNRLDEALELYSKTIGRESSNYLRSEMHCRLAEIYIKKGDRRNAMHSLEYAAAIYPGNARASLLKEKINQ